jgi:RNase P/RNase MRP subunit p29
MLYIPEILLGLHVRVLVSQLDGHQEITISGRDIIFRRDCITTKGSLFLEFLLTKMTKKFPFELQLLAVPKAQSKNL